MSMKKLAVLATFHNYGGINSTEMNPTPGSPPAPVHGVNVMLGGAMISGIILVVFILCYCCHKTHRKAQTPLQAYWRDPGISMEIYTVETQTCFNSEDRLSTDSQYRPPTPGPPPAYDVVVPMDKITQDKVDQSGLPSYETAVKLGMAGYEYV